MKQLVDALRSAKKIEILIIIIMLCVLLVLSMNDGKNANPAAETDETRLSRILSCIEGAGKVNVMLSRSADGLQGCVAASPGGDDMRVVLELQRAIRALTGLELDCIEIIKSKR